MSKRTLYLLVLALSMGGYSWLAFNLTEHNHTHASLCLVKNVTGIPCPACGSTRSVLSILTGNFVQAFSINPIGYVLVFMLTLFPIWIILDLIQKKDSFYIFYNSSERILQKKYIGFAGLLLVLLNWIWNINKGL